MAANNKTPMVLTVMITASTANGYTCDGSLSAFNEDGYSHDCCMLFCYFFCILDVGVPQ